MGHRLAAWRALDRRERWRLLACIAGVSMVHASLAVMGYARTRGWIESLSGHGRARTASGTDIDDARTLARIATIAGNQVAPEAACLRQSLLLLGWLRFRGLRPVLHLGVKEHPDRLLAHAWLELEGVRLREADTGYRSFFMPP